MSSKFINQSLHFNISNIINHVTKNTFHVMLIHHITSKKEYHLKKNNSTNSTKLENIRTKYLLLEKKRYE